MSAHEQAMEVANECLDYEDERKEIFKIYREDAREYGWNWSSVKRKLNSLERANGAYEGIELVYVIDGIISEEVNKDY